MQIFITLLAISLIAIGIFRVQSKQEPSGDVMPPGAIEALTTPSATINPPADTPTSSPVAAPTKPIATPTPKSQKDTTSLDLWIYPESTVHSRDMAKISLQSSDDPTRITNWYKNKIKELRLNATSTVQTNTNNTIHNVLAASDSGTSVNIDITKNASESSVSIVITHE